MRVAMIGCGDIAGYHVPAMRAVGFKPVAVCSRPGSMRARDFARRFQIPHVFDDAERLIQANEKWDALLISVPPEVTLPILKRALTVRKPILVEKPVAVRSADLVPLLRDHPPLIVGYNRRFYAPVQVVRRMVRTSEEPLIGQMVMSETVRDDEVVTAKEAASLALERFIYNGVHALDVMRFVCGEVEVARVDRTRDSKGRLLGLQAVLRSLQGGHQVYLTALWNKPVNVSFNLYGNGRRINLEPLESMTVFRQMQRIEPTSEMPVRRYVPLAEKRVTLDAVDDRLKPGLYRQAEALRFLVNGGNAGDAATLHDAYCNIRLVESLFGATAETAK